MMELRCAYILIIVSSVCASPYGYGTKGGAVAKAEASATAGISNGVSGLPYSVPSGAGFSGSFSKSSASSFASSSASSSSSSSSFSFSGTGAGALHGLGANGGTRCESGGCLGGAHGITDNHGSGATGISKAYSAANAAATNGITGTHGTGASGTSQAYSGANAAATNGITGTHGTGASGTSQAYSGANAAANNGITGIHGAGVSSTNQAYSGANAATSNGITGTHGAGAPSINQAYSGANAAANTGMSGTHGAGVSSTNQAYSGANAGAAAAAGNLDGPHGFPNNGGNAACTGSECLKAPSGCVGSGCTNVGTSNKCNSGQCGHSGHSTSHINSDTKCISGQCGVNTAGTGSQSSNSDDSNDIPAKVSTSSQNSKEQHSNYDKTSTLHESTSGPGCSHGNCGSLVITNLKPTGVQGSFSPYQNPNFNHGPKCDSPDCNTYDYNANSVAIGSAPIVGYHKPATYLTTPKQGSSCTSSECQLIPSIGTEKPSSYNVPIHASYDHTTEQKIPSCNGGICDYQQQKGPNTVTGTSTLPLNIPTGPSGSGSNCAFGKCHGHTPSPSNFDFNGPKLPSYSQGSLSPYPPTGSTYKLPTAPSSSTCTTPNCAPTTHSASETNKHVEVPTGGSDTYPHTNPSYITPGFGHPSHSHKTPLAGNHYSNCNTPNCAGYSSLNKESGISSGAKPELSSVYPSGGYLTPGLKNPSYTTSGLPSYTTPTFQVTIPSCSSPNCAGNPSLNAGIQIDHTLQPPIHSGSPQIPSVSGIFSSPSKYPSQSSSASSTHIPNADSSSPTCKTPHCAGYSPVNAGAASHTEQMLPVYTDGFGGPAGLLQPNEFSANHFSGAGSTSHIGNVGIVKPIAGLSPSHQKLPTYTNGFGGPSGLLKPNEFSTGTLSANSGATAGSTSGIVSNAKPSTGVSSTDQKQPSYTGGFGAPSGLLKPNELSPSHSSSNADVTIASNAGSASFAKPSTAQTGTAPGSESSDHNAPSGIQKPDFNNIHPATDAGISTISHTGSVDVTNPSASSSDEKLPPYTGGFGGAAGILKPNEFKIPTSNINKNPTHVSTYNPISCSSGNCGSQPGHLTPAHVHGSGLSGAQASAAAVANAEASAYSGGFGGPPGFLKPYDGGKLQKGGLATGGKLSLGSEFDLHHGSANDGAGTTGTEIGTNGVGITNTGAGVHSPHNSYNIHGDISGSQASKAIATAQASAVAQASATAGASSGAFGGRIGAHGDQVDIHGNKHESGSCGGGCGSNGGDTNLNISKGLGWSKTGTFDSLSAAGASAKSTAGAVSGARALGIGGGSFASSSASADATSGFPTKGGYGR